MFACAIGFEFHACDDTHRGYVLKRPANDMKMAV